MNDRNNTSRQSGLVGPASASGRLYVARCGSGGGNTARGVSRCAFRCHGRFQPGGSGGRARFLRKTMEAGISSGQHGPLAIRAIDEKLDLGATLFVFANKSGKRMENHVLLLYFLDRLKAYGNSDPGRCCIAVTEENSYQASHARSYGFLAKFLDPPGITGRYSWLLHFGLLMSALWRFDPADLVSPAAAICDLCRTAIPPSAIRH
jgi:hypothetical protein